MGLARGINMISIIVPVYNVEIYIRECLNSILTQTMRDFELILVDDGSTDNSGDICEEFKAMDKRIKVFHKENGGLSSARNKGLDEASGEYVCFVDSDDVIRSDYLEKLYEAVVSDDSDMAFCDIEAPRLSDAKLKNNFTFKMTSYDAKKWLYDDRTKEYVLMVVAWNKIYSSKIFRDIRYPYGKLHEDEFIILPILNGCSNISFVSEKMYFYRENESGITSDSKKMNVEHLDCVDALSERIALALADDNKELALITLKNALYKCAGFYKEAKELDANEMKKASMTKYKIVLRNYKDTFSLQQKMKYLLFAVCPDLFIKTYNP